MKAIIFGPPGSGKGTYASRLSREFGVAHISTGNLLRDEIKNKTSLGREIESYTTCGELVPDDRIIGLLANRISQPYCAKGFILDGYPRTIPQAEALETIASPSVVVNLRVPDTVIIERLSTRLTCRNCGAIYNKRFQPQPKVEGICDVCNGNLYKRDDDEPEVVRERLDFYRKMIEPLLSYYEVRILVKNISCKKTSVRAETVVEQIVKILNVEIMKTKKSSDKH